MAWCTTTCGHSLPFTAWIDASVTPPSSAGALSCSESHTGNRLGSPSRLGQLARGRRDRRRGRKSRRGSIWSSAVALASSPPSPMLGPQHGQDAGRRPASGCAANELHVVGEVSHLAGLPGTALALEPAGKAAPEPSAERCLATRSRRQALMPRLGRRATSRSTGRGSDRARARLAIASHASAARTPPRWRNRWLTPPVTGIPPLRSRTCTGASEALTRARTAISTGSRTPIEKLSHPTGGPGGRTVLARRIESLQAHRPPRPTRSPERPGSPSRPARRCGSTGSSCGDHGSAGSGS